MRTLAEKGYVVIDDLGLDEFDATRRQGHRRGHAAPRERQVQPDHGCLDGVSGGARPGHQSSDERPARSDLRAASDPLSDAQLPPRQSAAHAQRCLPLPQLPEALHVRGVGGARGHHRRQRAAPLLPRLPPAARLRRLLPSPREGDERLHRGDGPRLRPREGTGPSEARPGADLGRQPPSRRRPGGRSLLHSADTGHPLLLRGLHVLHAVPQRLRARQGLLSADRRRRDRAGSDRCGRATAASVLRSCRDW